MAAAAAPADEEEEEPREADFLARAALARPTAENAPSGDAITTDDAFILKLRGSSPTCDDDDAGRIRRELTASRAVACSYSGKAGG